MIETVQDILQRFEISHYGFLPHEEPLSRLPNPYYEPWERIIYRLPELLQSNTFYDEIANLPTLCTNHLQSEAEWRRSYVILAFFTHAYTWGGTRPREILPPCITIPLLQVSEHLSLPPIATYPALNLWNCGLVSDKADITNPENVVMRHTLTGTYDEAWFYAVSVSVEAKGITAIKIMFDCIEAVNQDNRELVARCLKAFTTTINELGQILRRMHENCDPMRFYHQIRPFLAGSKGMEKAGLPNGVFYDEGDGKGSWRKYSGGSNAQSTLIQFLDVSLGVEHKGTGENPGSTSTSKPTYLTDMRTYMPRLHREFLDHYKTIANVRQYATSLDESICVRQAFDEAVDALTAFRDIHINIVARYIVMPSRMPPPNPERGEQNLASSSSDKSTSKEDLKGTGGTVLMTFLKQTRDETRAAKQATP